MNSNWLNEKETLLEVARDLKTVVLYYATLKKCNEQKITKWRAVKIRKGTHSFSDAHKPKTTKKSSID